MQYIPHNQNSLRALANYLEHRNFPSTSDRTRECARHIPSGNMVKVPIYLEQGIRSHVAREVIESADSIICLVQRSFPARS
jgi:hypothetical protein